MYQTNLQKTVHGRDAATRRRYILALKSSSDAAQFNRGRKMELCSCTGQFVVPSDRPGYVRLDRCGRRLCPLCARLRAARVRRRIETALRGETNVRHVVLTVRGNEEVLRVQIDRLMSCWRRFIRTPAVKARVQGGLYCVEVSRKSEDALWHAHLHVLYVGLYYAQRQLACDWSEVVGEDSVVWISAASERHAAYLAKYIGAPDKLSILDPARICEYESAIHGRRMIQCFGTWHGKSLDDSDPVLPSVPATEAVPMSILLAAARGGHSGARRVLSILSIRYPFLRSDEWPSPDLPSTVDPPGQGDPYDVELRRSTRFVRELRFAYAPFRPHRKRLAEDSASTQV